MNTNDPLVSVIIVNYNGRIFLEKCLASLSVQTYSAIEIIIVDNGSADDSVDYVKKEFPSVRLIICKENLGFAKGNNIGIKESKGELIATLNNDTEVVPEWIEKLVNVMNSDKNIGMCASKMLFMKNRGIINSTGLCISRSGACWDRGMSEYDIGQYDTIEDIFGPCAGAAMYRRAMFEEIGLFDEDFYAYMEDTDLAFRGRLAGWKCIYVPDAIVYHVHGGTAGYMSDYTVYYGNRNIIWYPIKNFPTWILIICLPWIIGRNIAIIPYYILKGYGKVILRSKVDGIKGIPRMIVKRSQNKNKGDIKKGDIKKGDIKKYLETWARPKVKNDES